MQRSLCTLLFAVLACVEVGWCCVATKCNAVVICPPRQQLLCAINAAKTAGTLDMRKIVANPILRPVFGNMPADLENIPGEIQRRGLSSMQGIEELLRELGYFFRNTIDITCLIPVRDEINRLIDGSVDNLLDVYHGLLVGVSGQPAECPNRALVKSIHQQALVTGTINVIGIIQNPTFAAAMFDLPRLLNDFLNLLNTNKVPTILVIEDHMSTFTDEYIDNLDETCYILVRDDLRAVITRAFGEALEMYTNTFLTKGGSLPLGCPNRAAFRSAIVSARTTGTFNLNHLLFVQSLSELNSMRTSLLNMQAGIHSSIVTSLATILSTIGAARANMMLLLEGTCVLWVLETAELIDQAFDAYQQQVLASFLAAGGSNSLTGCPNRAAITSQLIAFEVAGAVDVRAVFTKPSYSEFTLVVVEDTKIRNEVSSGAVSSRKTIFERGQLIGNLFRGVLTGTCQIDVESNLSELIQVSVDNLPEVYCALKP